MCGTNKKIEASRMQRESMLIKKAWVALLRPFKILVNKEPKYKKGHIKLKERMNRPASSL